jgi:hypothetical protein
MPMNPHFDDLDALNVVDVVLEAYISVSLQDRRYQIGAFVLMAEVLSLVRPALDPARLSPETRAVLDRIASTARNYQPAWQ